MLNEVQSQELGLMTLGSLSQLHIFCDSMIWDFWGHFEVHGKLPSCWVEFSFIDVIDFSWVGNKLKICFLVNLTWVRKATVIFFYPWCSSYWSVFSMLQQFSIQAGSWSFTEEFLIWASQSNLGKAIEDWYSFLYVGHRICMVGVV